MPYRRPGSSRYQVHLRALPGYGNLGPLTTRTANAATARRMEDVLRDVAERGLVDPAWHGLLDAVADGRVTLPDLLVAANNRRLDALKRSLGDPPLAEALVRLRDAGDVEAGVRVGLGHLLELAPAGARLSYLLKPKHVTALCRASEAAGRKRNSVRRYTLRAISALLREEYGNAERDRVMAEVRYAGEDDTREVHLTPDDVARLLAACDELAAETGNPLFGQLRVFARLAMQTSADRGVLLAGKRARGGPARGLLRSDLAVYELDDGSLVGEAFLDDRKTEGRARTVPLTDAMCRELLPLAEGRAPSEPVFDLAYEQADYLWRTARERAGLLDLRIKDLRAQFAIAAEEVGLPQTVVVAGMGHNDAAMTRRYQRRRAALSPEQAAAVERGLGLDALPRGAGPPADPGPPPSGEGSEGGARTVARTVSPGRLAQTHGKGALAASARAPLGTPKGSDSQTRSLRDSGISTHSARWFPSLCCPLLRSRPVCPVHHCAKVPMGMLLGVRTRCTVFFG